MVEEKSSEGLDPRMPCPQKGRTMVSKGATVIEDRRVWVRAFTLFNRVVPECGNA